MRFLVLLWLVAMLLSPANAAATPSGPFPTITVLGPACEPAHVLPAASQVRLTFENVSQSCAGQQCYVIQADPIDATAIEVRHNDVLLEGHFKRTDEKCGQRPVWVYSLPVPASGTLMFSSLRAAAVHLTITAEKTPEVPNQVGDEPRPPRSLDSPG